MFLIRALSMAAFSLSIGAGLPVHADSKNCVKAYREANTRYFKEIEGYKNRELNAQGGTLIGGAVGVACLVARRQLVGATGCLVVGGLLAGPPAAVWAVQARKIHQLEDARSLYQLYFVSKTDTEQDSPDFNRLVEDTGAQPGQILQLKKAMVEMVEEGVLCDDDGQVAASYDDVVDEIKEKVLR